MSTSFIKNPEIGLILSNKSVPKKKKPSSDSTSQQGSLQVQFSDREIELLKKVNDLEFHKGKTNDKKENVAKNSKTTSLTLKEVKDLKSALDDSNYLCDIVNGAELKLPENEIVERNPVLEKRIQRLKMQQEQRVYDSMTKNVDSSRKYQPEETISFQCKLRRNLCNRSLVTLISTSV